MEILRRTILDLLANTTVFLIGSIEEEQAMARAGQILRLKHLGTDLSQDVLHWQCEDGLYVWKPGTTPKDWSASVVVNRLQELLSLVVTMEQRLSEMLLRLEVVAVGGVCTESIRTPRKHCNATWDSQPRDVPAPEYTDGKTASVHARWAQSLQDLIHHSFLVINVIGGWLSQSWLQRHRQGKISIRVLSNTSIIEGWRQLQAMEEQDGAWTKLEAAFDKCVQLSKSSKNILRPKTKQELEEEREDREIIEHGIFRLIYSNNPHSNFLESQKNVLRVLEKKKRKKRMEDLDV
jgi:hypothetical protein